MSDPGFELDERVLVVASEPMLPFTQDLVGSVRYVMPDGAIRVRLDGVSGDYFFRPEQLTSES